MLLRRIAPEVKLAAATAFVLVVALTPAQFGVALAIDMALIITLLAVVKVPPAHAARRALPIVPFLALAALLPLIGTGDRTEVLGASLSIDGLWSGYGIATKALIGSGVSIALISTTTTPQLLIGLQRLRVPAPMISIASLMVRYMSLVSDDLARSRLAMTARGHDPRWLWQVRPIASSAGAAFVRSYERGERVHGAMLSRGFNGEIPDLGEPRAVRQHWLAVPGALGCAGFAMLIGAASSGLGS